MTLVFQCDTCFALHDDVDACRKCKHDLPELVDLEAQSVAATFIEARGPIAFAFGAKAPIPREHREQQLAEALAAFALRVAQRLQRRKK